MRLDEPAEAAKARPVLFVVDADPQARARTESALTRRFGADYSVQSADSASGGLAALERLARAGTPVADPGPALDPLCAPVTSKT